MTEPPAQQGTPATVFVGLGSNIERERHLTDAVLLLDRCYAPLTLSSVYESDAVGFDGEPFFNMVVSFTALQDLRGTLQRLHEIESQCGRDRRAPRFGPRTLDADLLAYGDQVVSGGEARLPREEILSQAFVLGPLAEIAPRVRHPVVRRPYRELWQELRVGKQIRRTDFDIAAALTNCRRAK